MKNSGSFFDILFSGQSDPYGREIYRLEDPTFLVEKWRNKFSIKLYRQTGNWHIRGMDWHVFRSEYATAIEGEDAIAQYRNKESKKCFIFTHANSKKPLGCTAICMPHYEVIENALSHFRELADAYITPSDLSWTFVVTHETSSGIGPFYAESK